MLLTVQQTAKKLDLSEKRVYGLIAAGRIRKVFQFGRILITDTEVKRFKKLPRQSGRPWPKNGKPPRKTRV